MIDLETLDTEPTSTILTIGAQGFSLANGVMTDVTFYKRLNIDSQADRTINDDTVNWWGKQSEAAQEEALGDGDDRVDIETALKELSKVCWKHKEIWANGTTFDIVILENAFKQYGVPIPWKFWQVNDARTVYKLVPQVGRQSGNTHNALEDCVNQIELLFKATKIINLQHD